MTMSRHIDFAHRAETALPGLDPARLREAMIAEALEHGLEVMQEANGGVAVLTAYGRYTLVSQAGKAHASIESPRADWLFALKEALTEKVSALHTGAVEEMRWSDALPEGSRPPNFQFVEIRSITSVGRDFLRVTVGAEDLSAFGDDAIHFRLVLPAPGDAKPEWPRIAANGATIWPKGEKALHRPVYTVRQIDMTRGELTFDLFVHEGGRATDWARSVRIGSRVGLTGPGGGGIPQTLGITLYADETGFPAAARILEALPPEATGRAVLSARVGAACGYPMPTHPGVQVHWRAGESSTRLADRAIAERATHQAHSLWFAAEKAGAQKLRVWCKANGVDLRDHYVAAFWTQGNWT